jgi:chromosome segregation protein
MTDVIFNGSINRSAHGRASVELVFDNPHNRVPGEFGRFTEISVRREVLRDGSNHYQINGQKCRRKDVTDLFLGTGLGPRYAIIEQGTVSRLVESRPADLKLFMEEAAGVSRYKGGAGRPSSASAIPRRTWSASATSAANWARASSISRPRPRPPSATSSSRAAVARRRAELIGSELWALETRLGEAKTELAQTEQALAALDAKRTADEGRHVTCRWPARRRRPSRRAASNRFSSAGRPSPASSSSNCTRASLAATGRRGGSPRRAYRRPQGPAGRPAGATGRQHVAGEVASARLEQCEQLLTDQQSVRAAAGDRLEQARQRQQQWQQQLGQLQGRLNQTRAEVNGLQELQAKTRLARLKLEDEQAGPLGGRGEPATGARCPGGGTLALPRPP